MAITQVEEALLDFVWWMQKQFKSFVFISLHPPEEKSAGILRCSLVAYQRSVTRFISTFYLVTLELRHLLSHALKVYKSRDIVPFIKAKIDGECHPIYRRAQFKYESHEKADISHSSFLYCVLFLWPPEDERSISGLSSSISHEKLSQQRFSFHGLLFINILRTTHFQL